MHDQSSDPKESTLEKVSDNSFVLMEKLCETVAKIHDESLGDEDLLLDGIEVPNFNDTLEEVEFILEMGAKLKANPQEQLNSAKSSSEISFFSLEPPLKRLKLSSDVGAVLLASTPNATKLNTSMLAFVTPMSEFASCRSMINQVCVSAPFFHSN